MLENNGAIKALRSRYFNNLAYSLDNTDVNYKGEKNEVLWKWVAKLLFTKDCETLLTYPEWKTSESFQNLWQSWWRHHAYHGGSTLTLVDGCWSPTKVVLYHRYLSIHSIKIRGLRFFKSRWPTEESWDTFVRSFATLPLAVLDLSNNGLGDEQLVKLAIGLRENRTIMRCVLDRNKLSYKGLRYIVEALAAHPTLTSLSIRENFIRETDKKEFDRNIGSMLRDIRCRLRSVDLSGNYLISRGNNPKRLEALRQLLYNVRLTAEEFAQAEWIAQEDSPKGRDFTVLRLKVGVSISDFEVPIAVITALTDYGHDEKIDSPLERFNTLRNALRDTLPHYPDLRPRRLCAIAEEKRKDQKSLCKQLLFFHPQAPLKSYLKRQTKLCSPLVERLVESPALLSPGENITPQMWKVYFVARKGSLEKEHALLVWEGLYSYGQKIIKMADLIATTRPGQRFWVKKDIVIQSTDFDINRLDSFRRKHHIVAFRVPKKRVKEMMLQIEREVSGELPQWVYKELLSFGSFLSAREKEKFIATNCIKWALEKLECCLEMKEGTIHMGWTASATAIHLQSSPRAECVVEDDRAESELVSQGVNRCCI